MSEPSHTVKMGRASRRRLVLVGLLACACAGAGLVPQPAGAAEDSSAGALKQDAQRAYLEGRFAEAIALDLRIARERPEGPDRRYAVQMLGTLYEENVVDLGEAIRWHREYLERYADRRQAPFYERKLAELERLVGQKDAFADYQRIRFAHLDDEALVKRLQALLKDHPGFQLKDEVQRELGRAYARLDDRKRSYLAFQALSPQGTRPLAPTDRAAQETAGRYWRQTAVWGRIAWAVVAVLWAAVVLLNPWKQIGRATVRTFLILALLWAALTALRMPTFYSLETLGYPIIIPDTVVYAAAGLNLTILAWVALFTSARLWQMRRAALRVLTPVLAVAMTTAVLYLLVIHQSNGPQILDAFSAQYQRWSEEWRRPPSPAADQGADAPPERSGRAPERPPT